MGRSTTVHALVLAALVAACGKSEAVKACRGARASAAQYLGVVVHGLATKTEIPAAVTTFEPSAPAADPDTALWEAAIGEANRLQVELNDAMIATGNAREALREPTLQSLKAASATLLDDEADAATTARAALGDLAKLEAIDTAMAKHAGALVSKTVALRDRLDARLAQTIKDADLRERISMVRTGADLQVSLLEVMRQLDDRYAIDKLALEDVIATCR